MSSSHTADAAGGEAIYSSDGLSPLPIPPPPATYSNKKRGSTSTNDNEDDTLDYETKDVIQAFEIFSGKVFQPHPNQLSLGDNDNQRRVIYPQNETKLEKLARIQAELHILEEEQRNELNTNDDNDGHDDDNSQQGEMMMQIVNDLSNRLKQLQNNQDVATRQQNLTSFVKNLKIKETEQSDIQTSDNTKNTGVGLSSEQRLFRIERFLGSQINNHTESINGSILERLKQAEDKLNSIDEQTLNQAASRAKVIRADLEAAAKARSKISNTNVEDAAKIAKLHDQLVDMDGFLSSNILPTIVNRLSSCASLHSQAMEFGSNLKALEEMVNDVEVTLESVEKSVQTVEMGLVENMKIITKNMEQLDQK